MTASDAQPSTTRRGIFAPSRYDETRRPIEEASPLPRDVYFSQEWYDREVETVFLKKWLIATREEEIPNPGDYVRLDIIDEPLIILRDETGAIRALSASCRHRGSELLVGSGNYKKITCPYHAWTYALDGRLPATPSMQDAEDFDKSVHALPSVRARDEAICRRSSPMVGQRRGVAEWALGLHLPSGIWFKRAYPSPTVGRSRLCASPARRDRESA